MLTTPNLEKYRQGDFIQYMNNLLSIIHTTRAATFNVVPQRDALQQAMQNLNNTWQPKVGSELTPEIAGLDKQRDLVFNSFKITVDAWATGHYDAAVREAAFIVSDNIALHGNYIYRMRYQQQTATMNAIIRDLEGSLFNQVTVLGLTTWVAEIKALNMAFDEKYMQRIQAVSGLKPGVVDELIAGAIATYRTLKNIFEARFSIARVDGETTVAEFEQAANEWEALSQQYNDAVNRPVSNGADEPTDNGDPGAQLQSPATGE